MPVSSEGRIDERSGESSRSNQRPPGVRARAREESSQARSRSVGLSGVRPMSSRRTFSSAISTRASRLMSKRLKPRSVQVPTAGHWGRQPFPTAHNSSALRTASASSIRRSSCDRFHQQRERRYCCSRRSNRLHVTRSRLTRHRVIVVQRFPASRHERSAKLDSSQGVRASERIRARPT
jgi:hypothetical protein